jgi:predicted nucleic acid-binding protein
MYADADFWVALLKDDDWLGERAERLLREYEGDLETSIVTFIELFLIEERFDFDRDQAALAIFELAETTADEDVVFQASEYIDDGLNTFDAFHAAIAGDRIISSDQAFNEVEIERIALEPDS